MPQPRVVVVPRFRFKHINGYGSQVVGRIQVWVARWGVALYFWVMVCGTTAFAGGEVKPLFDAPQSTISGYLVRIEQNNPAEVEAALLRAEAFYLESGPLFSNLPPIALVLHGPEVEIFFRENYRRYKNIVDLAARLTAFEVVDIKICRTRLRFLEQSADSLFPFVGTVAFGPAEIARLTEEEGYVRF